MRRCLFALRREFTRRLKSKREESAARILQEEQLVKSRKRQQAPVPPANRRLSSLRKAKDKLLNYLDHGHASASEERPAVVSDIWHYMWEVAEQWSPVHFCTLLTPFSSPTVQAVYRHLQFIIGLQCFWLGGGHEVPAGPHRVPGWAWVLWAVGAGGLPGATAKKISARG